MPGVQRRPRRRVRRRGRAERAAPRARAIARRARRMARAVRIARHRTPSTTTCESAGECRAADAADPRRSRSGDVAQASARRGEDVRAPLPHPVHRARAARAARGGRGVDRRQADRLVRDPAAVRRARRSWPSAFRVPEERVRVIVPDTGSAYGGKHTGEHAIEAARLAQGGGQAGEGRVDARRGVRLGVLASGRRHRRQGGASTRAAG